MSISNKIVQELKTEFRYTQTKNGGVWVCCPFHGERTPSLKFNLDATIKVAGIGHAYCFGCGYSVPWNKFVRDYRSQFNKNAHFTILDEVALEKRITDLSEKSIHRLQRSLAQEASVSLDDFNIFSSYPVDEDWRGVKASILNDIGCQYILDRTFERSLFIPCDVGNVRVGAIKAHIEKSIYINSQGTWTKTTGLFPYDYIVKQELGSIVLVEGPRDALNLIQKGVPAIAILGVKNWSKIKLDWILSLDLTKLIICMDGDKAGVTATNQFWAEFSPYLDVEAIDTLSLSKKYEEKIDGGNAPDELLDLLRKKCYARFGRAIY